MAVARWLIPDYGPRIVGAKSNSGLSHPINSRSSWIMEQFSLIHCCSRKYSAYSSSTTLQAGPPTPSKLSRKRLGEKRQALVHPVIDTGMVVGELLVAMRNAKLVQPPHQPAGAVEQVELVVRAAVDVERL
jgi:hypothetical protein